MNRIALPLAICSLGILTAQESVDLSIVHQIKQESFKHSKVMDHLFYLSDVYGPRLTASKNFKAAADWAVKRLTEYGLSGAKLEKWGPFGRSWSYSKFSVAMTEPQYAPLIGFPLAWSRGTNGPITAEPMLLNLPAREFDLAKRKSALEKLKAEYKGKLKGKIIMLSKVRPLPLVTKALATRYTDQELATQAQAPDLVPPKDFDYAKFAMPEDPQDRQAFFANAPEGYIDALFKEFDKVAQSQSDFLREEGALAVLESDNRSDGGTVFGESAGGHEAKYQLALPTVSLTPEHYNRLGRLLEKKIPVKVTIELAAEASEVDVDGLNIVAEIPGGKKKDEIIMVGGHFDSWIGGTGATDNGCGSAVAMEVVRILKALNLKMDRTVRIGLWGGEEEGLYGSKAYVKEHFGDPETMKLTEQHAKLSGYFNLDNGSGKVRGVYLQNSDAERPLFERWLAPFRDLGVGTISIRNTGGTDHLSFDAVGLPGYQFIQEPLEYGTRTHHSNMDVVDHVQAGDLMQAAAVIALVVYEAANRGEMMPRKPLPKAHPKLEMKDEKPVASSE